MFEGKNEYLSLGMMNIKIEICDSIEGIEEVFINKNYFD